MSTQPPTKKARKVAPKIQEGVYKESKTSRGPRVRNVGIPKPPPAAGPSRLRPAESDIEMQDEAPRFDPFESDRRFIPTLDEIRATYGKVSRSRFKMNDNLTTRSSEPKRLHARISEQETSLSRQNHPVGRSS